MNNRTVLTNLESALSTPGYRPLPGHCVIRMDIIPGQVGSVIIPDAYRQLKVDQQNQNSGYTGKVVAMTPRLGPGGEAQEESFEVGDHVFVMLLLADLDSPVISTLNTRVYAIHTCEGGDREGCKWRSVEV